MKIVSEVKYKSLKSFTWENIPKFSVLTGKNGSGKSQLLSLISYALSKTWKRDKYASNKLPEVTGIEYTKESVFHITNNWELIEFTPTDVTTLNQEEKILYDAFKNYCTSKISEIIGLSIPDPALVSIFEEIYKKTNANVKGIPDLEVFTDLLPTKYISQISHTLTNSKLALRFYSYHMNKLQSMVDNNGSAEKFITENGSAPWVRINEIFNSIGLDLAIVGPTSTNYRSIYYPSLRNSKEEKILFSDLSSGEKVLVSIVCWLFNSKEYNTFPSVLLLDEPDAYLHPEMTLKLISVLNDILCAQFGVTVIMSTHSPSTVALTPEDALFEVNNSKDLLVSPISKDLALEILTEFVPTLSIDYKNHHQIYCESPTDVKYFQSLHNKDIVAERNSSVKLYFISNSAGEGNSSEVYSIVDQIRKSGNKTFHGIVDWDLKNRAEEFVLVHGENSRYSIENFILDPFYIIGLLFQLKDSALQGFEFPKHYNFFSIGNESETRLQSIADTYFNLFQTRYPGACPNTPTVKIEYFNGKKIDVPEWFLKKRGHDIEPKIKEVFKSIGGKFSGTDSALHFVLIDILATCYPFVPTTSIELLRSIN